MYGLLQRSDKKYEEATKCYRNALKWDKVHPIPIQYCCFCSIPFRVSLSTAVSALQEILHKGVVKNLM